MTLADLQEHVRIATFLLPIVLLSFALHEMAHAFAATFFGDPTPRRYGRVTLNPVRHLDPVGTVMLVVTMLVFGFPMGFAVTPVNDEQMRRPRLHGALTLLAGPLTNVLLCAVAVVLFSWALDAAGPDSFRLGDTDTPLIVEATFYAMVFNAFLAVFNMLPVPPLDGGRIVGSLLADDLRREWRKIDEYGIFIVIALVIFGGNVFRDLLAQLQDLLLRLVGLFVDLAGFGPGQ